MKKASVLLLFLCYCFILKAQHTSTAQAAQDSIIAEQTRLRFTFRQLFVPAGLIIAGSLFESFRGLKNDQLKFHNNHFTHFHTNADNYLQYVPGVIPYAFDIAGIQSKTDVANRTVILIKAEILQYAVGNILKHTVREWRPDGSDRNAFPSGHTEQAFATATILSEEYGYRFKWMPYVAYTFASGVGALRIANNKHYIGDVLVGAGIGILSAKLAYWTHRYKWGKKKRPALEP
ncbi:MAG: phosphatase PAP2 family protein [Arachidicoccus sp.]|nr:phosphatase PAP2 family protein [Arachidicoccus sp.]